MVLQAELSRITIVFFRYNGVTLAVNHDHKARKQLVVRYYVFCSQYNDYKKLMDTAASHLENKEDGKWIFNPITDWIWYPLSEYELDVCKQSFGELKDEDAIFGL